MNITQLHDATDATKINDLVASMTENGWIGRPVLALDCGDYLQAITGSHRIAAAEQAGIDVSVYTIQQSVYTGNNDDEAELFCELIEGDDDARLSALRELVDRGLVDSEALEIIEEENN